MGYRTQVETILALPIGVVVLTLAIAAPVLVIVLAVLNSERRADRRAGDDA